MAGLSLSLQNPYRKSENPDLSLAKEENKLIQDEIKARKIEIKAGTKQEKDLIPYLNKKETRIYLFLIIDRTHMVKIKTEYAIYPIHWDFGKQQVKRTMIGHLEINERLKQMKETALKQYSRIIAESPGLSFAEFFDRLTKAMSNDLPIPGKSENRFFAIFNEFIEDKKTTQTHRTIQKYETVKKSLTEFSNKHYKYGLNFADLDLNFLDKYLRHLRTQPARGRQKNRPDGQQIGLLNDTIEKYIATIRTFVGWSQKRIKHSIMLPADFRISRNTDIDVVALNPDELKALYTHDFSNDERLDHVRDLFCFAAFTGQRWSDVEAFNPSDVSGDCWKFRSFKTKKDIKIYFVGFAAPALDILKKYNFKLPEISQQKFNDYIKLAAEDAEINSPVKSIRPLGNREVTREAPKHKFLSSHSARRTCVSILLNYEHLPLPIVMQITGHTKLEVLQKYIFKDREAYKTAMQQTQSYKP
ncbi:MAG: hypothetical protein C0397_02540 [Odoribacter sp.]|nr:hypothetical protein [Odoribacter sp.]